MLENFHYFAFLPNNTTLDSTLRTSLVFLAFMRLRLRACAQQSKPQNCGVPGLFPQSQCKAQPANRHCIGYETKTKPARKR